jgi:hypothetical protein
VEDSGITQQTASPENRNTNLVIPTEVEGPAVFLDLDLKPTLSKAVKTG